MANDKKNNKSGKNDDKKARQVTEEENAELKSVAGSVMKREEPKSVAAKSDDKAVKKDEPTPDVDKAVKKDEPTPDVDKAVKKASPDEDSKWADDDLRKASPDADYKWADDDLRKALPALGEDEREAAANAILSNLEEAGAFFENTPGAKEALKALREGEGFLQGVGVLKSEGGSAAAAGTRVSNLLLGETYPQPALEGTLSDADTALGLYNSKHGVCRKNLPPNYRMAVALENIEFQLRVANGHRLASELQTKSPEEQQRIILRYANMPTLEDTAS